MEQNEKLLNLIQKYATWAKFDYMDLYIDTASNKIRWYDMEEHTKCTLNQAFDLIFDNGMLNECYTQEELKELLNLAPTKNIKKEIKLYIKKGK